ncbi:MAG: type II toxin-antitoxin system VapC family toxin [Bacteroidetes bacterium]|nr:MAG: type II toxin-antitoxin system VapC family toxin [Bacteroidota bacterium]
MARELILLDTSILIEYFRKENKKNSALYQLVSSEKYDFAISVITFYEVYIGVSEGQKEFWDKMFSKLIKVNFNTECAKTAVKIQKSLKNDNKMIAIPDLLIGATAKNYGYKIATKNVNHFERIPGLQIIQ